MLKFSLDKCIKLAQDNPEALEDYRKALVKQLINHADPGIQQRLKGIQFKIDMERRKAHTAMDSCLKLHCLMIEFFQEKFVPKVHSCNSIYELSSIESSDSHTAKIIPFKNNKA